MLLPLPARSWLNGRTLHNRVRQGYARRVKYLASSCLLGLVTLIHTQAALTALTYSAFHGDRWVIYYQADLDSAPEPVAAHEVADGGAPALAPDGRRVAFDVHGREIHVCSVDETSGCRIIRLPDRAAVRPAWRPVTGELAFAGYATMASGEDSELYGTRDALDAVQPLIEQTGILDYPSISPDGRRIAYSAGQTISLFRGGLQVVDHLWILDLTTGHARPLLAGSTRNIHPAWSPSGSTLAFASNRSGQFEIWVIDGDGGGLRQVTSGASSKTWPAWSPDSESIMFTRHEAGRYSLWLINADGSDLRPFEPFGPEAAIQVRDADWK